MPTYLFVPISAHSLASDLLLEDECTTIEAAHVGTYFDDLKSARQEPQCPDTIRFAAKNICRLTGMGDNHLKTFKIRDNLN